MSLFDFVLMGGNYEERKVANFQKDKVEIDTCAVTDSDKPFETGIKHPAYNDGSWVIVQLYETKSAAIQGHRKWIRIMTAKELPKELRDVSTAEIAGMVDVVANGEDWRTIKQKIKEK